MEHIDIGEIEISKEYPNLSKQEKDVICDKMIDDLLTHLDYHLDPHINRIAVLEQILQSTLITSEMSENYEVCAVIRDIQNRLDEA